MVCYFFDHICLDLYVIWIFGLFIFWLFWLTICLGFRLIGFLEYISLEVLDYI